MRNPDGTLIGDLNDNIPAYTSGGIVLYPLSTTNENLTTYDLLPVFVNKPPIIISPISEASDPPIKPYASADATGDAMYLFPDGAVKVMLGATFTFKIQAVQPSILNVENGIPTMLPPNDGLTYVWRKDGSLVTSYINESLQASLLVSGSTLKITNVQPEHAGTYVCEVQNDIGITSSETINLEVLNLDFDEYFYKNLIRNPYGKQGVDEWETNSSDFVSKQFSEKPSEDFKRTNRVDLFGYTSDMLHPRPYQIDTGVLKGFNMVEDLVLKKGSYFTRDRLKYIKKGGTNVVRAYQDIDMTDVQPLIKGGVFGVEGVRAIFSCYLGNAINTYNLVRNLLPVTRRTETRYYINSAPRLSVQNTLQAGAPKFIQERVYVSIEEYDNDIRLATTYYGPQNPWLPQGTRFDTPIQQLPIVSTSERLARYDPWWFRTWYWYDQVVRLGVRVYDNDIYGVGTSRGDGTDVMLLAAEELYPNPANRYTFGQYAEFNKLVVERLNPRTTKVRIVLNFVSEDSRIFETSKELIESSDEIFDASGWEFPWAKNTWSTEPTSDWRNTIYSIMKAQDRRSGGTDPAQFFPLAGDSRVMATALNLTLLPVLKQNSQLTQTQTNNLFIQNNAPASVVPNVLQGRSYDPLGLQTRKWQMRFQTKADGISINPDGTINSGYTLELSIQDKLPSQPSRSVAIDQEGLLPLAFGSTVYVEGIKDYLIDDTTERDKNKNYLRSYIKYKYVPLYNYTTSSLYNTINDTMSSYTATYSQSAQLLSTAYAVDNFPSGRVCLTELDTPVVYQGKVRFCVTFALPGNSASINDNTHTQLLNTRVSDFDYSPYQSPYNQERHKYPVMSYYLDLDFSDQANTKVSLLRSGSLFPPDSRYYDDKVATFELPHKIENGKLICDLMPAMSASMLNGGMQYKTIKQTLPANQFGPATVATPIILNNERTTESIVRIVDHPVECIRALRTNIGAYSYVPVVDNYFYQTCLNQIIDPLTQLADPPAGIDMNAFVDALVAYANDVPYYFQIQAGAEIDTTNEPDPAQSANRYFTSTLELDMGDTTFANPFTFNTNYNLNSQPLSIVARQTNRSENLLNLRSGTKFGPSLVCLRSADPAELSGGIGSPSYGLLSDQSEFIVGYSVGDSLSGTYL